MNERINAREVYPEIDKIAEKVFEKVMKNNVKAIEWLEKR